MLYGYRKYMTAGIVMIEATVVMIMPAEIMSSSAPNCLASINGMFPAGIATITTTVCSISALVRNGLSRKMNIIGTKI